MLLDAHQGIEPRHRLLEDHPEVGSAEPAQLSIAQADEVSIAIQDLSVGRRANGQQPEQAASKRGLPATRLADEPENLPFADVERDAIDGTDRPLDRAVVHAEIADGDDGRVGH